MGLCNKELVPELVSIEQVVNRFQRSDVVSTALQVVVL